MSHINKISFLKSKVCEKLNMLRPKIGDTAYNALMYQLKYERDFSRIAEMNDMSLVELTFKYGSGEIKYVEDTYEFDSLSLNVEQLKSDYKAVDDEQIRMNYMRLREEQEANSDIDYDTEIDIDDLSDEELAELGFTTDEAEERKLNGMIDDISDGEDNIEVEEDELSDGEKYSLGLMSEEEEAEYLSDFELEEDTEDASEESEDDSEASGASEGEESDEDETIDINDLSDEERYNFGLMSEDEEAEYLASLSLDDIEEKIEEEPVEAVEKTEGVEEVYEEESTEVDPDDLTDEERYSLGLMSEEEEAEYLINVSFDKEDDYSQDESDTEEDEQEQEFDLESILEDDNEIDPDDLTDEEKIALGFDIDETNSSENELWEEDDNEIDPDDLTDEERIALGLEVDTNDEEDNSELDLDDMLEDEEIDPDDLSEEEKAALGLDNNESEEEVDLDSLLEDENEIDPDDLSPEERAALGLDSEEEGNEENEEVDLDDLLEDNDEVDPDDLSEEEKKALGLETESSEENLDDQINDIYDTLLEDYDEDEKTKGNVDNGPTPFEISALDAFKDSTSNKEVPDKLFRSKKVNDTVDLLGRTAAKLFK